LVLLRIANAPPGGCNVHGELNRNKVSVRE